MSVEGSTHLSAVSDTRHANAHKRLPSVRARDPARRFALRKLRHELSSAVQTLLVALFLLTPVWHSLFLSIVNNQRALG